MAVCIPQCPVPCKDRLALLAEHTALHRKLATSQHLSQTTGLQNHSQSKLEPSRSSPPPDLPLSGAVVSDFGSFQEEASVLHF